MKCYNDDGTFWETAFDVVTQCGGCGNAYHEYILDSMKQFDDIAQGDKDIFLKLFDKLKNNVKTNPEMLYKDYWK